MELNQNLSDFFPSNSTGQAPKADSGPATGLNTNLGDFFQAPRQAQNPSQDQAASPESVAEFVKTVEPHARKVAERLGVPVAAVVGQWGLETGWGRSVVPGTNNLGNIKDTSGAGVAATDNQTGSRDKYRQYDTVDQFAEDFTKLLGGGRYKGAMGTKDAQAYFSGLKAGGYAEDPAYVQKGAAAAKMAEGHLSKQPAQPDLSKAPRWADVQAKPEFQALSPQEKEATKAAYFDHWIAPQAGAEATTLREKFLTPAQPAATAQEPGFFDKAASFFSGAADGQRAPGVVQGKESVLQGAAPAEGLPTDSKAPVRPEVRAAFNAAWDAATPGERQAMAQAPGWQGMLARERTGQFERYDQGATPTGQKLDPRAEARTAELIAKGEAAPFAQRAGQAGAARGVAPGQELRALDGTAQPSTYDFDTKQAFDPNAPANGLNNPLVRGLAKGGIGMVKAAEGVNQALYDVFGADELAKQGRATTDRLRAGEQAIGERGDFMSRNLEGAISSIAQQLPLMVGGVRAGAEAIPLAGMALQSFGQEYSDGRAQGQTVGQALGRASIFAAFEVIGERFGLKENMAAIKAAAKGMPADQIVGFLWGALKKEVPGEVLTTTGQFGADKLPGGVGLNPNATGEDYLKQVADTIGQTIMQAGVMAGGTTGVSKAVQFLGQDQGGTTAADAEFAKAQALAKWDTLTKAGQQPQADRIEPTMAPVHQEHQTSQDAQAIVAELAQQVGLPIDTVLPKAPEPVAPPPPAAEDPAGPAGDGFSDQDVLNFAAARFQDLRERRDGSIQSTVGDTGIQDQDLPGAGLSPAEAQEMQVLQQARGDVQALRQAYGLKPPGAVAPQLQAQADDPFAPLAGQELQDTPLAQHDPIAGTDLSGWTDKELADAFSQPQDPRLAAELQVRAQPQQETAQDVPQPSQPGTQASQEAGPQGPAQGQDHRLIPLEAVHAAQPAASTKPRNEREARQRKALDRIARGTAYFAKESKAQEFVKANGLGDTHTIARHPSGANRWDVVAKDTPTNISPTEQQDGPHADQTEQAEAQRPQEEPAAGQAVGKKNEPASNGIYEKLRNLFRVAVSRKDGNKNFADIGPVSDEVAKRIHQATGFDVAGYTHSIDESAIRHIVKEHGDAKTEEARGQIAIGEDDIVIVSEIVSNPDEVTKGNSTSGKQTVVFKKKIGDAYVYVQEVRDGRKKLAAKTLWKVRIAPPAATDVGEAHTSETIDRNVSTEVDSLSIDPTVDKQLQDALGHLGDVLSDVFQPKANAVPTKHSAADLLPALSKVIELLVRKGFKSFSDATTQAARAMRGNEKTAPFVDQISPRQWKAAYNAIAEGHDGTDSEDAVHGTSAESVFKMTGGKAKEEAKPPAPAPAQEPTPAKGPDLHTPEDKFKVVQELAHFFEGGGEFKTIVEARKKITEITGQAIAPGTETAKQADEAIETAVVLAGRAIVAAGRKQGRTPQVIYDRLVDLYNRQPNLAVRSSTSVRDQAYSTPVPLAYLASELAGITPESKVLEPTAGNGMLMIGAAMANSTVNELNPKRAAMLNAMGFKAETKNAATENLAGFHTQDAVIANPPFGITKNAQGDTIVYQVRPQYSSREVDHAISFKALATMKDDGRAVLIVGGSNATSEEGRREDYRGKSKREFYFNLYQAYNVTDHFTVDGAMYSRQGASYPVDVIVINGRGKSTRDLPAADLPAIIPTYDALKEKLNAQQTRAVEPTRDVSTDRAAGGDGASRAADGTPVAGGPGRPGDAAGAGRPGAGSGSSRGGANVGRAGAGKPAGSGRVPGDGKLEPAGVPELLGDRRGPVSSDSQQRRGSPAGDRADRPVDLGGSSVVNGERVESGLSDRRGLEQETEHQVEYTPHSGASSVGTLVPKAMRDSIDAAIQSIEDAVGNIDEYVAGALAMDPETVRANFSAEQVDALALGIRNAEAGKGFIIGDQTGIGKGRVVAAMIRYALVNDKTPIFVTEKPNLYSDMIRDLDDIGMTDELGLDTAKPKIFITNGDEAIPYTLLRTEAGEVVEHNLTLKAPKRGAALSKLMQQAMESEDLGGYRVIFTTYSQLQTVAGKVTDRMRFVQQFGAKNFMIFDESHNAGGAGETQARTKEQRQAAKDGDSLVTGRAAFVRGLVSNAFGTFFSSATYAKRPDVMDLYSSTNMKLAVDKIAQLGEAIKSGGVPMQQVVANMLTKDGQYIRRERTFAGVSYDTKETKVDKKTAENMASAMRAILAFSRAKDVLLKAMQKELDKEGSLAAAVGGEKVTVQGANFGSIMHNLIDQMLLALKAKSSVEHAIARLKAGEKVVMTVSNTMESFLKDFAEEVGLNAGDPVTMSFADLYDRYLEKQRLITVKDATGAKTKKRLSDKELGPALVAQFNAVRKQIRDSRFGDAPISPIDYIHAELAKAGYKTDEITGRKLILKYDGMGGAPVLSRRSADIKQRVNAVRGFNGGDTDVIILNQAGSTGLSLHAASKVKDKRKRHMIIVQAEKNIDTHMQMLGRVHRTGQVVAPAYSQMMADIPAEMRPAAVLMKKMASLNANTTASRKSSVTADGVVDFMNDYGGQVAQEFLRDNPDVVEAIGGSKVIPLDEDPADASEEDIRKLTGYLPMLPIAQQEKIYADLIERYNELLAREDALGTNKLEAKAADLGAKTISSTPLTEQKQDQSIFAAPANMEQVDVKRTVKPFTSDEVRAMVNERLAGTNAQAVARKQLESLNTAFAAYLKQRIAELEAKGADPIRLDEQRMLMNSVHTRTETVLRTYGIGTPVSVADKVGGTLYGVITDITQAGRTANPAAGSDWRVTIAVANGDTKSLTINFSQIGIRYQFAAAGQVNWYNAETKQGEMMSVLQIFDRGLQVRREKRWMVTGNLLAGYAKYPGQILTYTKEDGTIGQGVLMNRQFDFDKEQKSQPVTVKTTDDAMRFMDEAGSHATIGTPDGVLRIMKKGSAWSLIVPSSKREGGTFFLDQDLTGAIKGDFFKRGSQMVSTIYYPQDVRAGLEYLLRDRGETLVALTHTDKAREILGGEKDTPKFSAKDENQGHDHSYPDHSEATRRAIDALERELGGTYRDANVVEGRHSVGVDSVVPIAEVFGTQVVGYQVRPEKAAQDSENVGGSNGFFYLGRIFLNVDSQRPHLALLGHETAHKLAKEQPALYNKLVDAIAPYVKVREYEEKFAKSSVGRGSLRNWMTDAQKADSIQEEFVAEVLSDGFMDPEFWRALGSKNKELLYRVQRFVGRLIEKAMEAAGYKPRTAQYLSDYAAVMRIAGGVMAEYRLPQGAAVDVPKFARIMERETGDKTPVRGVKSKPTETDLKNVRALNDAVSRELRKRGVAIGDNVLGYVPGDVPDAQEIRELCAATGIRVQWFTLRPGLTDDEKRAFGFFNGANFGGLNYLRAEGVDRPHLAIIGHEMLHQLRKDDADLYDEFVERVAKFIKPGAYNSEFLKSPVVHNVQNPDKQREEFMAEISSDAFMRRDFWEQLGKNHPTLLARVVDLLAKLVDKIRAKIGYSNKTERILSDFDAVMKVAEDVLGRYMSDPKRKDGGDIAFNTKDLIDSVQSNLRQFMGSQGEKIKTFNWWDKRLATQFHKALKDPHYGRVFAYVNAMQNEVSLTSVRPAELAPQLLPKFDNLRAAAKVAVFGKASQKGLAGASRAVFAGTLYGKTVLDGKVWSEEELRNQFGLDDEGVELYRQARAAIDASLDEVAAAEGYAMAQGLVPKAVRRQVIDNPAAAETILLAEVRNQIKMMKAALEHAEEEGEAAAKIESMRATLDGYKAKARKVESVFTQARNLKNAGYAPLMRFGKYTVTVQEIDSTGAVVRDEKGEPVTHFFGQFETRGEANEVRALMERQFAGESVHITAGVKSELSHQLYAGLSPETLALFADAIGNDNAALKKFYELALTERSALKRRLERKNVGGYNDDLPRVISNFLTSNGRFAAQRYYLRDLNNAIKFIPNAKGDVRDEAIKLKQFVMDGQDTGSVIQASLFAWFLGGSVASAAVNLTQPIMMTAPYLSQWGPAVAAKAMAKALPVAMGKKQVGDAELKKALKRAQQEGIVDAQEIFHLYSVGAQGAATWLVDAVGRVPVARRIVNAGSDSARARINAFNTLWGSMFAAAEGFNRRLTFVAAWNVAKAVNNPNPYAFAVRAVNETQGIYNKGNRPNLGRSPMGRTVLTFKQFSIMYLELLKRMTTNYGPAGKMAAASMLAVLMLAAGEEGLPFAQNLDDLVDGVGQAMGYDTNMRRSKRRLAYQILGKTMGDLFLYGISSQLPLDFSGRLGMGNIVPGTGVFKQSEDQNGRVKRVLEILGPTGSQASAMLDAYDAATEGNVGKAAEGMAPKAVRDVMAASSMLSKGYSTDSRGRKVIDVTPTDAGLKAVGFNPTRNAEQSRKTAPIYQDLALQKNTESSIVDQWARALAEGDDKGAAKQQARLDDWNRKNPDTPIQITAKQLRSKARSLGGDRDRRLYKSAPKEMRGNVAAGLDAVE